MNTDKLTLILIFSIFFIFGWIFAKKYTISQLKAEAKIEIHSAMADFSRFDDKYMEMEQNSLTDPDSLHSTYIQLVKANERLHIWVQIHRNLSNN